MRLYRMARFCAFFRVWRFFVRFCVFSPAKMACRKAQICALLCKIVQKALLCNTPFSYTPFCVSPKNATFTRSFSKNWRELLPPSLSHESETQRKLLRRTCSDELSYFGWTFSGGFSSCELFKQAESKRGREEGDGTENVKNRCDLSQIVVTFYDDLWRFMSMEQRDGNCQKNVGNCHKLW